MFIVWISLRISSFKRNNIYLHKELLCQPLCFMMKIHSFLVKQITIAKVKRLHIMKKQFSCWDLRHRKRTLKEHIFLSMLFPSFASGLKIFHSLSVSSCNFRAFTARLRDIPFPTFLLFWHLAYLVGRNVSVK